ncbi:MAG: hypothetical protein OEV64_02860 [Desulfobulbaceae bacterium]|nr:hypothetical protein [Desulfobulbaceae bacterium]
MLGEADHDLVPILARCVETGGIVSMLETTYAVEIFIFSLILNLFIIPIRSSVRHKIKEKYPEEYRKILGDDDCKYFDSGGFSSFEYKVTRRYNRFVYSRKNIHIIGEGSWYALSVVRYFSTAAFAFFIVMLVVDLAMHRG